MKKLCDICPRNCNVNREKNYGVCLSSNKVKISKVMLHYYEEPPISGTSENGTKGSGAIFFSNCSLKCVYCQNYEISSNGVGREISIETLANLFKQLELSGANNINLVSPTHYTLQIIEALKIYKPNIPIVWNTSGYEKADTIKLLKDYVDIYLTDFKYFDNDKAQKFSNAKNYPETCKLSILEMRKNCPNDIFENGLMKKGIIIRHLVLPNQTRDSQNIIKWIYDNLGNQTYVSLMSQYVPMHKAHQIEEINRKITPLEYKVLVNQLNKLNFKNVFLQDYSSASDIYTPDFKNEDNDIFKF